MALFNVVGASYRESPICICTDWSNKPMSSLHLGSKYLSFSRWRWLVCTEQPALIMASYPMHLQISVRWFFTSWTDGLSFCSYKPTLAMIIQKATLWGIAIDKRLSTNQTFATYLYSLNGNDATGIHQIHRDNAGVTGNIVQRFWGYPLFVEKRTTRTRATVSSAHTILVPVFSRS